MLVMRKDSHNLFLCIIKTKNCRQKFAKLQRGLTLRANSLWVTLYGDALAARNAPVSLGSLIDLAGLFGLSSRLVRTSAFRLTADGWFDVTRVGGAVFMACLKQDAFAWCTPSAAFTTLRRCRGTAAGRWR